MFGLGASLLSGFYLETVSIPLLLIGGFIGSVIPDLDLRYRHRVLFHNILFLTILVMIFMTLPLYTPLSFYLSKIFSQGFIVGFSSHLLGDVITYRGVALLYPFKRKMYKIPVGTSESLKINLLGYTLGVIMILLSIYLRLS
ncbi:MAG: metal-dependent hydrolase [Sulfolobales archaeon]